MAKKKKDKGSRWIDRMRNKYRLVVMNDSTFEERLSFRLSRMNVFVALGTLSIVLIVLTTYLIAFTPLREYIPGYARVDLQKQFYELQQRSDSLEKALKSNETYLGNIKMLLNGGEPPERNAPSMTEAGNKKDYKDLSLQPAKSENDLRKEIEDASRGYLSVGKGENAPVSGVGLKNYNFFSPLKGTVSHGFSIEKQHLGIDISAPVGESVHAVLEGTVIFSQWSPENGAVIAIQHNPNLISIYKHNASLLKKEGSPVKPGDAIATVGNTGENIPSGMLHFELWLNGIPISPTEFIHF